MPATSNNSANMSRRQSFNGKGLNFQYSFRNLNKWTKKVKI